jgi:hypothetical protein
MRATSPTKHTATSGDHTNHTTGTAIIDHTMGEAAKRTTTVVVTETVVVVTTETLPTAQEEVLVVDIEETVAAAGGAEGVAVINRSIEVSMMWTTAMEGEAIIIQMLSTSTRKRLPPYLVRFADFAICATQIAFPHGEFDFLCNTLPLHFSFGLYNIRFCLL